MASHVVLPNCLKLSMQQERGSCVDNKRKFHCCFTKAGFRINNNDVSSRRLTRLRRLCVNVEESETVDDLQSCSLNQDYLINENGWVVRNLVPVDQEMRQVAFVQAQAFHVPVAVFNHFFFQFFQAEVLAALLYRLKNSPSDRYACLVAQPSTMPSSDFSLAAKEIVGVVDITVLRDKDVVRHLQGAGEYIYVSGIAVLNNFRRKKVATALLKACDTMSKIWGYEYLVLRAYEDDYGARELYTNAGYNLISGDAPWMTTWIGRKRRILMIKRTSGLTTLSDPNTN